MQVEAKALYNTKMLVPIRDAVTVQRRLIKAGFGYELALEKAAIEKKFKKDSLLVAFFIDRSGFIEFMETSDRDDLEFHGEFHSYEEDEVDHNIVY